MHVMTLTMLIVSASRVRDGRGDEPGQGGRIVLVAGQGSRPTQRSQPPLNGPFGVGFDADGALYFVEMPGQRVRKLLGAGSRERRSRGPAARGATVTADRPLSRLLNGPHSLAVARNGDVFVADTWNNRVRKIDARSGIITTVAGTGRKGFSGDGGPALQADFGGIYCLALDEARADARSGRPR